jgi:hypothetical protein
MFLQLLLEDKKRERSIPRLRNNSDNKDYLLASAQDPDNAEELTDIFSKVKNSNSMPERSNKRENHDCQYLK